MKEERVKKVTHKIQIYKSTHHEPIDIEFKDLNFSYKDSEPILKKISMKIKENDRIILRGKSGAGKTTLCKIIT